MNVYEDIYNQYGLSLSQQRIVELVGREKIVLEIGASSGYITKYFIDNGCIVDVVEVDKQANSKLSKKVRKIINLSIENSKITSLLTGDYDFIVMADVLEHLIDPEKVLRLLHKIGSQKTKLLISMPNVASWPIRKELFLRGDFQYQQSGILDKTHLHFYTLNSLPKLLSECGWQVKDVTGTISRLPFERVVDKLPFIKKWLIKKFPNLAYHHFMVVAQK